MPLSYGVNKTIQCNTLISLSIPRDHFPPIIAAFLLFYVITIFSNCILIYTLRKTKQLNTISNKLILIMSISDLGLGAIAFPTAVVAPSLGGIFKSCIFEKTGTFLLQIFSYFSLLVLTCISIDRYLRVTKMNRYNLYMNKCRMKLMVFISILAAAMVSMVSLVRTSFEQQIFVVCLDVVVVGFTGVVYTLLLKRLQNHIKSSRKAMPKSLGSKIGGETNATCTSTVDPPVRIKGCDRMVGKSQPETVIPMENGISMAASTSTDFEQSNGRFLGKSRQNKVRITKSEEPTALGMNSTSLKLSEIHSRFLSKSKSNMGRSIPNEDSMSTNKNSNFSQSDIRFLRISRRSSKMPLESEISEVPGANGSVSGRYTDISQENTNKELSAVKTIQGLLVLIFVTYVPYNISSLLWTYQKFWKKEYPGLKLDLFYFWSSFIGISNGFINAWIIIFGNTRSRRFVASIFRKNKVNRVSNET